MVTGAERKMGPHHPTPPPHPSAISLWRDSKDHRYLHKDPKPCAAGRFSLSLPHFSRNFLDLMLIPEGGLRIPAPRRTAGWSRTPYSRLHSFIGADLWHCDAIPQRDVYKELKLWKKQIP